MAQYYQELLFTHLVIIDGMNDKTKLYTSARSSTWDKNLMELEKLVSQNMLDKRIPGVAVGFVYRSEVYWACFGITDFERPKVITERTLFQIGSITKTFTATATLRLAAEGYLNLETPLQTYLPHLKLATPELLNKVTVKHLLNHTSGWQGDMFLDTGCASNALDLYIANIYKLPQLAPPGKIWGYNNTAYSLLGNILEKITNLSFNQIIFQQVLNPLGLKATYLIPEDRLFPTLSYPVAQGHDASWDSQPRKVEPKAVPTSGHPAGGITSNLTDMLSYVTFHLSILQCVSQFPKIEVFLRKMYQPQIEIGEMFDFGGLGWMLKKVGDIELVGHAGTINGFSASLQMVPTQGVGIIVLTNAYQGDGLCSEVINWILSYYFHVQPTQPIVKAFKVEQSLEFEGDYLGGLFPLKISWHKDRLVIKRLDADKSEIDLSWLGDDNIIALNSELGGSYGKFLRDEQGRVRWLRFASRLWRKV